MRVVQLGLFAPALSACLSAPPGSAGGGDAAPDAGCELTADRLIDDFDEGLDQWELIDDDEACIVATGGGQLQLEKASTGVCGVRSRSHYQLTGAGAVLELDELGDGAPDLGFAIRLADNRRVAVAVTELGVVLASCPPDGGCDISPIDFASSDVFWRLRYDPNLEQIIGDLSLDGQDFSDGGVASGITIEDVACIGIEIASYDASGDAGEVVRVEGVNTE